MKTQTQIELVKAYLALAALHRQVACEGGRYGSQRDRHTRLAETAEIQAIAWSTLMPFSAEVGHV